MWENSDCKRFRSNLLRVSSSCSTCGTHHVTFVTNHMISYEGANDRIVIKWAVFYLLPWRKQMYQQNSIYVSFLFGDHSVFRFLFAIVLSVILRLMASDGPFGIFKLFLNIKHQSIHFFFHFSPISYFVSGLSLCSFVLQSYHWTVWTVPYSVNSNGVSILISLQKHLKKFIATTKHKIIKHLSTRRVHLCC
jgi:hypothetical protein